MILHICQNILVSLSNCLFESQNSEGLSVTFRNKGANKQFLHYWEELLELGGIIFINYLLFLSPSLKVKNRLKAFIEQSQPHIIPSREVWPFTWSRVREKKLPVFVWSQKHKQRLSGHRLGRGGASCVMENVWPDVKSLVSAQIKTIASQFMFLVFFLMSHPRCSVDVFLRGLIVELTSVSRGLPDRSFFSSLSLSQDFIGHKWLVDV